MKAPMTIKQYVSQMKTIPGGRFTMGRTFRIDDDDADMPSGILQNNLPPRSVDIRTFKLGATPVTVGMWREYVRANPRLSMPDAPDWGWVDDHPMVKVSWYDIMGEDGLGGYCVWASRVSGLRLTLPTESEWEYCAKSGSRNFIYPWGNEMNEKKSWGTSGNRTRTAQVYRKDYFHTNRFGITDLVGNVNELCMEPYERDAWGQKPKRNRLGYISPTQNGREHLQFKRHIKIEKDGWGGMALRGAGFTGSFGFSTCSYRTYHNPIFRDSNVGFRLSIGPK